MRECLKEEQGFSLLELLVYVAIVGVLMAVAVPKYQQAMAMANTARIQSDLRSLDMAVLMYEAQNGRLPTNLQPDLEPYIVDLARLRPPQGKCLLRTGESLEINAAAYALAKDRSRALCQEHAAGDFGAPDKTAP
jgi:general secretion pathway protein G